MKSVVQVVKNASIVIDGVYGGSIERGLVVLVAYRNEDTDETIGYMTDKILNLRVFPDENGKLNLSVK
ncbi:MAG TPA: D-tyrosyl-tRNA(Tyr) deacylase, partial [Clostridiales bacterium]|nr:D-tyrosyl-tRNA(Tyr) deacylase [Clostridiales bacterium]